MSDIVVKKSSLVERSTVPTGLQYSDYRQHLRADFFYSCAYCTMSEAEARAIRFTIDHYEPRSSRKDLENNYDNLMYACDNCNMYKGDRCPPEDARVAGHRFFRPDSDEFDDHFEEKGIRLNGRTPVGEFTIQFVELNRQSLRKLRELRRRLYEVDEYVSQGLRGLRRVHFDRLPKALKQRAQFLRLEAEKNAKALAEAIDEYLASEAASPFLDADPDAAQRAQERAEKQREFQRAFPGSWRARNA